MTASNGQEKKPVFLNGEQIGEAASWDEVAIIECDWATERYREFFVGKWNNLVQLRCMCHDLYQKDLGISDNPGSRTDGGDGGAAWSAWFSSDACKETDRGFELTTP